MSWTVSSRACRSRPADRARFAAVCRAWRSAARQLPSHLPWIVFPGGTFCTAGVGAACFSIPGLPDDATCLGAAHDCWLAIDCTDDVVRRATFPDTAACDPDTGEPLVYARRNVKHNHTYLLHNPFSNLTVPLPELDAVVGYMAETFTIRKVLMRSPAPDDFIAVTTNNCNYNIILCRREKGTFVLPDYRIIDVVFLGDTLYGITSGEELLAFHLSEDDEDGRPNVTRIELVIKNPLSRYYYGEFPWYWPEHEPNQEENDNSADEGYLEEEDINEDEESDDDELADQALEDILNGDDLIPNNVEREVYDEAFEERYNREVPYEPKDEIVIGRYLVKSRTGELLLVRHRYLLSPYSHSYTHNVQVLKANLNKGKWAASDGLPKGEALFLGQSYSKCTQAHGDIREGFVYYLPQLVDDAYDMTSCTTCNIAFGWPWQCKLEDSDWLTWLFPPEVVV
ncbi:hypothetical protein BDA96_07G007900 [Sorghum bicolor]|uniref:KIB1-4 beta-propeller domain-containing protein n=2 Tax=Sorghum bicolor TaxID=4558 RepID=A0A921U8Y1_SORBI|nr:hypothetical protein BDA96_07G007900 [Sorghum bicolor]KXG24198.1 hypothetical protein SORBI_3007G007400 [Sorghum bicolor]